MKAGDLVILSQGGRTIEAEVSVVWGSPEALNAICRLPDGSVERIRGATRAAVPTLSPADLRAARLLANSVLTGPTPLAASAAWGETHRLPVSGQLSLLAAAVLALAGNLPSHEVTT